MAFRDALRRRAASLGARLTEWSRCSMIPLLDTEAALVLREDDYEPIIPPMRLLERGEARSRAVLVVAAGIMLRDIRKNPTAYEVVVEALKTFNVSEDEAQRIAGELVNPDFSVEPAQVPGKEAA